MRVGAAWSDGQSTAELVAAARAGDRARTAALVAASGRDPWRLVDELCRTASSDEAQAVAAALDGPDVVALRAYARHPPPEGDGLRAAVLDAKRQLAEGVAAPAARLPVSASEVGATVLGVEAALLRSTGLLSLGETESAREAAHAAAQLARALGWLVGERDALAAEVEAVWAAGRHADVLVVAPAYRDLANRLGDASGAATAETYRGLALAVLARYAEADVALRSALAGFDDSADVVRGAQVRSLLSGVLAKRGDYAQALAYLEQAEGRMGEGAPPEQRAELWTSQGDLWTELSEFERARPLYVRALGALGEGATAERAHTLASLGWLDHLEGDAATGLPRLEAAAAVCAGLGDASARSHVLRAMGQVQFDIGQPTVALATFREAIAAQEEAPAEAAHTWICLAQVERTLGRLEAAGAALDEAARHLGREGSDDLRLLLARERAATCLARGELPEAASAMRSAFGSLREVATGLSDAGMIGAERHRDRSPLLELALAVAFGTDDPRVIVEFLEMTRAHALLYALGGRDERRFATLPEALERRRATAGQALARAREDLSSAETAGDRSRVPAQAAAVREAEASFLAAEEAAQRHLRRARAVESGGIDELATLQGSLASGEALVYYALLAEGAKAVVVLPSGVPSTRDLGPAARIRDAAEAFDDAMEDPALDASAAWKRLETLLVEPLRLPEGVRRVFVSPDGPIAHVPVSALLAGRGLESSLVPSGTVGRLLGAERARTGVGVLALGDPVYEATARDATRAVLRGRRLGRIEGTRDEVLAVTSDGDTRLLREDATEGRFLQAATGRSRWSSIHLACHGLVDALQPGLSALALTPHAGEDGYLTAVEVFDAGFRSDLVVLSACRTGRGALTRSEGSMSLARAFLAGAAPRVIVSLWNVDDQATRALMTRFYAAWRDEGKSTAAALEVARASVRAEPRWAHPRFWSAWVLWGLAD